MSMDFSRASSSVYPNSFVAPSFQSLIKRLESRMTMASEECWIIWLAVFSFLLSSFNVVRFVKTPTVPPVSVGAPEMSRGMMVPFLAIKLASYWECWPDLRSWWCFAMVSLPFSSKKKSQGLPMHSSMEYPVARSNSGLT